MNTIVYLFLTTIKNRIFNLRKKPIFIILYGIMALSIIIMIIASTKVEKGDVITQSFTDIRILYSIVAGVGLLFLFLFVTTGLTTGSTLFSMADVGLLFVAPISSKKILVYGLIKQMGTTFLSAIFIMFQIGTIKDSFGLKLSAILNIFLMYAIIIFFCQLMSMAVYIFTNGNPVRKKLVKGMLYGAIAVLAVAVYLLYLKYGGSILDSVLNLMDVKLFHFFPVIGWAVMFVSATIEGNVIFIVISMLLFLFTSLAIISLFTTGDADYYEDVLNSTELYFTRLQDAKDGKRVSSMKKVKIKEDQTGLKSGKGYNTLFYKHILEKKRTSRFVFIDTFTIIVSIGVAVFCKYLNKEFSVYIVLGVLIYFQFFMTILGKLSYELTKPYIYMIPEKSVNKVLAASITTLLKPCVDAIIIFTVACIFSKTSPLLNLFLAMAYASSGAIFVSYTILCQRIFGGQPNKIISALLGMSLFLVIMAPGIGASITSILLLPKAFTFLGTLPFTFCCVVISIFVFVVCGDLLDKTEYTGK